MNKVNVQIKMVGSIKKQKELNSVKYLYNSRRPRHIVKKYFERVPTTLLPV